jgi:MOSC domain-containing protein YiiM
MSGSVAHIFLNARSADEARAVSNLGLEGDKHCKPDSKRQVLLIDAETLEEMDVAAGALHENIVTRGIDVQKLAAGTRVRVGAAVLELTMPCAPCPFVETVRPGLLQLLDGRRGVLARVIEGGVVRVGDEVRP